MSWEDLKDKDNMSGIMVRLVDGAAEESASLRDSVLGYLGLTENDIKTVDDLDRATSEPELTFEEVERAREEVTASDDTLSAGIGESLGSKATRLLHKVLDDLLSGEIALENAQELERMLVLTAAYSRDQS